MVSKGGKIAISLVVIVTIAVALMAWRFWKKRLVELKQEPVPQESINSTCTKKSASSSVDEDDAGYKECDYNNLGMHHSQLNVHLCKSSTCEVCTQKNPPTVLFVKSEGKTLKDLEEATVVKDATKAMPNDGDDRTSKLPQDNHLDIAVLPTDISGEHVSVEITDH
jgi:hypothetical protein